MRAASGEPRRSKTIKVGTRGAESLSAVWCFPSVSTKKGIHIKPGRRGQIGRLSYNSDWKDKYMSKKIYKGDIYYADLRPVVGSEQGGIRPVLIIQNNIGNFYSPTVIVAAISAKVTVKPKMPTHVYVGTYTGLESESVILVEQIRTIDKIRLLEFVGKISAEDMKQVERCLIIGFAIKRI